MSAHLLPSPDETVAGDTVPPRPDRAATPRPVRSWTVQCGYAAYFANTVVVEAATIEEACALAIDEANGSDGWRSLDHCGPTFVDAIADGNVDSPWTIGGSVLPVPDRFTEAGEAPTVVVAVAGGAVRDARIIGGPHPLSLVVITAASVAESRTAVSGFGRAPRLPAPFELRASDAMTESARTSPSRAPSRAPA